MRDLIFAEMFLDLYSKWQPGSYNSSSVIIPITAMATKHIENAINQLKTNLEIRNKLVQNLPNIGNEEYIDAIKDMYLYGKDVVSMKIRELESELESRE